MLPEGVLRSQASAPPGPGDADLAVILKTDLPKRDTKLAFQAASADAMPSRNPLRGVEGEMKASTWLRAGGSSSPWETAHTAR